MAQRIDIKTPVARLVQGSLYKGNTTDADGKPLTTKSGPNMGQPRTDYYFAVAIPKGPEQHWAHTPWGQLIYNAGVAAFPNCAHASPTFAWKIKDGDSQIPNRKGKKPCDTEGFAGHWVLSFSSGFAPKVLRLDAQNNPQPWLDVDAVNLGDWVEVFGSTGGNDSTQTPGVFLNHSMVCFRGYGQRIIVGPDAASVGFGATPLPAGVSATPLASAFAPALPGAVPGLPGMPALPQMPVAPAVPAMPAPVAAAPVAVMPHTGFLTPGVPGVPTVPGVPAIPQVPAAPVRQLTALAGGATYEQLIQGGWTDALLVQHGMMLP